MDALADHGDGGMTASSISVVLNPLGLEDTALLVGQDCPAGRVVTGAAIVNAGLMGLALVYLGEHYVLNLLAGGIVAAIGWHLAGRLLGGGDLARPRPRRRAATGSLPSQHDG